MSRGPVFRNVPEATVGRVRWILDREVAGDKNGHPGGDVFGCHRGLAAHLGCLGFRRSSQVTANVLRVAHSGGGAETRT